MQLLLIYTNIVRTKAKKFLRLNALISKINNSNKIINFKTKRSRESMINIIRTGKLIALRDTDKVAAATGQQSYISFFFFDNP